MFHFGKKKPAHCTECLVLHVIVSLFLFVAFVAAGIGVYMAHVTDVGMAFGTPTGSLALLAFVATLMTFFKSVKACMMSCEVCEMMNTKTSKK
jgi:hypothetical protein